MRVRDDGQVHLVHIGEARAVQRVGHRKEARARKERIERQRFGIETPVAINLPCTGALKRSELDRTAFHADGRRVGEGRVDVTDRDDFDLIGHDLNVIVLGGLRARVIVHTKRHLIFTSRFQGERPINATIGPREGQLRPPTVPAGVLHHQGVTAILEADVVAEWGALLVKDRTGVAHEHPVDLVVLAERTGGGQADIEFCAERALGQLAEPTGDRGGRGRAKWQGVPDAEEFAGFVPKRGAVHHFTRREAKRNVARVPIAGVVTGGRNANGAVDVLDAHGGVAPRARLAVREVQLDDVGAFVEDGLSRNLLARATELTDAVPADDELAAWGRSEGAVAHIAAYARVQIAVHGQYGVQR